MTAFVRDPRIRVDHLTPVQLAHADVYYAKCAAIRAMVGPGATPERLARYRAAWDAWQAAVAARDAVLGATVQLTLDVDVTP